MPWWAQREICRQIIKQGGDYVICLKGNQGNLYEDTKLFLEDKANHQYTNEDNAGRLNAIARSHWSIENQLHWRLDVVFNEDKACVRNDNATENIDILRK